MWSISWNQAQEEQNEVMFSEPTQKLLWITPELPVHPGGAPGDRGPADTGQLELLRSAMTQGEARDFWRWEYYGDPPLLWSPWWTVLVMRAIRSDGRQYPLYTFVAPSEINQLPKLHINLSWDIFFFLLMEKFIYSSQETQISYHSLESTGSQLLWNAGKHWCGNLSVYYAKRDFLNMLASSYYTTGLQLHVAFICFSWEFYGRFNIQIVEWGIRRFQLLPPVSTLDRKLQGRVKLKFLPRVHEIDLFSIRSFFRKNVGENAPDVLSWDRLHFWPVDVKCGTRTFV